MNDLLHDVFYFTGVLWWGIVAGAGLFISGVGAVEIIIRKLGRPSSPTHLRAVDGGGPPPPSTAHTSRRASRSLATNGAVRSASKPPTDKAPGSLGTSPANGPRPSFFDGGVA